MEMQQNVSLKGTPNYYVGEPSEVFTDGTLFCSKIIEAKHITQHLVAAICSTWALLWHICQQASQCDGHFSNVKWQQFHNLAVKMHETQDLPVFSLIHNCILRKFRGVLSVFHTIFIVSIYNRVLHKFQQHRLAFVEDCIYFSLNKAHEVSGGISSSRYLHHKLQKEKRKQQLIIMDAASRTSWVCKESCES